MNTTMSVVQDSANTYHEHFACLINVCGAWHCSANKVCDYGPAASTEEMICERSFGGNHGRGADRCHLKKPLQQGVHDLGYWSRHILKQREGKAEIAQT